MTQQKVEITRTAEILVASTKKDTYGNLIVTDKAGGEYKVGVKRERLFAYFQPDTAVHLEYAVFMNKEYIANAIPMNQLIKAKEPAIAVRATTIPKEGKITPEVGKGVGYKADPAKTNSIEKQTSLKSAVELAVADKIKVDEIISYATVFDMYLRGDFSERESEILAKYIAKYGRK